jgi:predicted nucleic acid-binding protein
LSLVLDSSLSLAWYFEDEASEQADDVLRRVQEEGAIVPGLWRYEVPNALQVAIRHKRINAAFRDSALARLASLNITIDPESEQHAWSAALHLSDRHGITVYDASYLELAQRHRLDLATLDQALAKAARAEFVSVIGS